jgi:cell division protein FtsQ
MTMANRRRRRGRLGILAAVILIVGLFASSPLWAVDLARRIPWLEVRRIEVSGTRLLAPHEVVSTSGIWAGDHLLDDRGPWESALVEHPVIESVQIVRRFPSTLRIRIQEAVPVALLSDGALRFVTVDGDLLPVDPFTVPLDLPVVHGSLADSASAEATRRALGEVNRLGSVDPALMREVSEIRIAPNDREALVLEHSAARIVIPFGAPASRLGELRRVLADVERRFQTPSETEMGRHIVDLRFSDQVVVRSSLPAELS